MKRHPNPRLVKIHRSYDVGEIADILSVHKNTVRNWIKNGLPIIDTRRPLLIQGQELRAFLQAKRTKNKRTCANGEIYCVGCRAPRTPAEGMADFEPLTPTLGNLVALCSQCGNLMYRRVNSANLATIAGNLEVNTREAIKD